MPLSLTFSTIKFGCDHFVHWKTFSPHNDRFCVFCSFKTLLTIYMKKEHSTSPAVANSNHLPYIGSFSYHTSILVCFTLPCSACSAQFFSFYIFKCFCNLQECFLTSLSGLCTAFFSHFIYCLSNMFISSQPCWCISRSLKALLVANHGTVVFSI